MEIPLWSALLLDDQLAKLADEMTLGMIITPRDRLVSVSSGDTAIDALAKMAEGFKGTFTRRKADEFRHCKRLIRINSQPSLQTCIVFGRHQRCRNPCLFHPSRTKQPQLREQVYPVSLRATHSAFSNTE